MEFAAVAEHEADKIAEAVVGDFNDFADNSDRFLARLLNDGNRCAIERRWNLAVGKQHRIG